MLSFLPELNWYLVGAGGLSMPLNLFATNAKRGHTRRHRVKELICQSRRHKRLRLNPWVGKIPWRRAQQPTPVLLPGKFHGQTNLAMRLQKVGQDWVHTRMREESWDIGKGKEENWYLSGTSCISSPSSPEKKKKKKKKKKNPERNL